ncbi:transposase, partial [Lacticaseibacillus rhamnosus]|uniref:transposase n=4 Tax=Lacticaseibacillus rhamnosus TaxID=47715 RepID=UPI00386E27B8
PPGKIKSARKTGVSPCLLCTNYNLYYSLMPIKLAVMLLSPATNYQTIERRTGTQVYFAHAYSPHERGSNENRNRVLRRFIPKGQAIEELSDHKLIQINWYLNSRPLKCLNWHTPIEIFLLNLRH